MPARSQYKNSAETAGSLYYYGARYYDPKTSVWLGVDPKAGKSPNCSPYSYCSDNPIIFIDPDGKFKTWCGAALYSIAHGGAIEGGKNGAEYFVGKSVPLKGSAANYQRRFDWNDRNQPNNEPSTFEKYEKWSAEHLEGGNDGANTGETSKQGWIGTAAIVGAISGIDVLCEGTSLALGIVIGAGVANNLDDIGTNSNGESSSQQLTSNPVLKSNIRTVKTGISTVNLIKGVTVDTPVK